MATTNSTSRRQSHDVYWKLPQAEREELHRRLLTLPREWARQPAAGPLLNYEAQQPPLYYLLMAPIQWAAGEASLPTRVLLMRLASLFLTSLTIPLAFAAGPPGARERGSGSRGCRPHRLHARIPDDRRPRGRTTDSPP